MAFFRNFQLAFQCPASIAFMSVVCKLNMLVLCTLADVLSSWIAECKVANRDMLVCGKIMGQDGKQNR